MKNTQLLVFILFLLTLESPQAIGYYPSTLWSSPRISESLVGVQAGRVTQEWAQEVVTLSFHQLTLYHINEGQMVKTAEYASNPRQEWIKLSLFDLNGDGLEEIILSGFYAGEVSSRILSFYDNQFHLIHEVPFYLTSLHWNGQKFLVSQKKLGGNDFSGPLYEMVWDGKDLVKKAEIKLPGGLSGEAMSLYSLQGVKNDETKGFVYLSPPGRIHYYVQNQGQKYVKQWSSGEEYGGSINYLNLEIKNPLNETENSRFYIPLRLAVSTTQVPLANVGHFIYVVKNSGYLRNVIGAVPSIKNSQIVRLVWTGYGYQEDWNSPRLDGAISDFSFIDWDGDGSLEIVATFLLRDAGYVDTLKKQDSLLIILDIPH